MATYVLCPQIKFGFDGTTDYTVNFYDSGGLTPASTWSDAGTTLNSATITLDANNTAQIYILSGKAYRAIYKNSGGTTIHDVDPILVADPNGNVGVAGTDLTLTGDLSVAGDASVTGALSVSGSTTIGGDLTVTGDTISNGILLSAVSPGFRNGTIAASAGSNAITITYVDAAAATPSATDPVSVSHRSATITSGVMTTRNQTAALSTVISSGSTLGCASSESVRIHIGLILNAGSAMELCYWTAAVASSTSIKIFDPTALVTTIAEGGAGAADSAQTVYSTTARTSQPMIYVGYIEATSGATAGQWSSVDKIVNWEPGVPMPGDVVGQVYQKTSAFSSGSTAISVDDSIPQISEGNQSMTQAYTAKSVMNWLEFVHNGQYSKAVHTEAGVVIALFDGSADALAAVYPGAEYGAASDDTMAVGSLFHRMRAGSVASKTYTTRYGGGSSTFSFNGFNGSRMFGGVSASMLEIKEIHG